jgi:hypothetical protein
MSVLPQSHERNRRIAPRKAFREAATVVYGGGPKAVRTWDLGLDGMCLLSPRPIAPGMRCQVEFDVATGNDAPAHLTVAAKVVHSSYSTAGEFKIGMVFSDLDDDAARVLGRFAAAP